MDLTEKQWERIAPLFDEKKEKGKGRPRKPAREILNGILWILRTGAPWKDLPGKYLPYQTCHRRFQEWVRNGTFQLLIKELAEDLYERGKIDIRETFIDGTFAPSKKGALLLALQNAAKAPKSWQSQTLMVFLSQELWEVLPHTKQNM